MAKAIEAAMGPELFDEERMAGLMAEYFEDKLQKTRALLEYANRDDARLSEAAGALQDDGGDPDTTAEVPRLPKPRAAPGSGLSARPGGAPRARDTARVPAIPRGARPRVAARKEALEPEAEAEVQDDTAATLPIKASRPAARANAAVAARADDSSTLTDAKAIKDEGGSKWASRLFLLVFFGAIGGLLYLEPVRNMLRPGYDAAVAWVKTELELTPPPPPPDTTTWPPAQKPKPPNPLAPAENAAPSTPEPATATAEPTPEPSRPETPEKTGDSVAKGTSKPGTTRPKVQPGKKPGEAADGTQTPSGKPRDLQAQLAAEPNTTVQVNPDGEPEVLDTKDPRKMRKARIGLLTLYTIPRAAVFDGQTSLGTTPLLKVPLPAGTYRLRVVDPEGNSRMFSGVVEVAKDNKYTIKVSDLPAYGE
jgi:serine/threonine-protein kinase